MRSRPYVLSIAGIDPSGGAGLYADIKTLEHFSVQGLGVCTAITCQNENEVGTISWQQPEFIVEQISHLGDMDVRAIKIGMVKNAEMLQVILDCVHSLFADTPIIWDPVLGSSSGTEFAAFSKQELDAILPGINMITPNWYEYCRLFAPDGEVVTNLPCSLLIKGGHRNDKMAQDILVHEGNIRKYNAQKLSSWKKRGTGCTLSSALAANIASGASLHRAILKSKRFVESMLNSNGTNYGWYRI